jgi:hypothetical protein
MGNLERSKVMKKLRRHMGIVTTISVMALCATDISWGLGIMRSSPNDPKVVDQTPPAKTATISNALSLKKEIVLLKKSLETLSNDKGYDETAQRIFMSMYAFLDDLQVLSKQMTDLEKEKEDTRSKLAALDHEHVTLLRKANSMVLDIKKTLQSVEKMSVEDPITFPERCFVMTNPDAIQKAGFKSVTGIIETFNRVWVLTSADTKSGDGVMRYHLSAQVGLMGSKDHNAGLVIRSHTPQNMAVVGLLDPKTNTIMCVSQPRRAGPR